MHAPAAEAGRFAHGIQAGQDFSLFAKHAGREIGLETAQRLSRQNVQLHADQRTLRWIEQAVRLGGANQSIAPIAAGLADGGDLQILAERILQLAIAGDDLALNRGEIQQRLFRQRVHALHELVEPIGDDKVGTVLFEGLDRAGGAFAQRAAQNQLPILVGQIGILFRSGECELALDDRLGQHEPGVLEARFADVFERAERVEAGIERRRQTLARRIEPQRRRPRQNADAMPAPDRAPVPQSLGVVPHTVAIDQTGLRPLR